jgi:hypothetical protein
VTPVTPGRGITEQSISNPYMTFVDEAYSGLYSYLPSVFMTGKMYLIEMFDAREPGKPHRLVAFHTHRS